MTSASTLNGRVLLVGRPDDLECIAAGAPGLAWSCTSVQAPQDALRALRADPTIDLVILAPGSAVDGHIELCRSIKFDSRTSFTSVVCILPMEHTERAVDFFDAGADDCIRMLASNYEILVRCMKVLRMKQAADSLEDATAVITALANAIEGKDRYTCGHVERVGAYCVQIGRRVGVDGAGLEALRIGGIVHDIGKIGIPDGVLNKPGKLTDEEMAIMRRHPVIGYDILQPLRTFREVLPIVRWHHERPNGTGYPDGLKGDELPLLPRITAVADCFDALATDRPYRPAFTVDKCKAILAQGAQAGDLDERLVGVLFEILGQGMLTGEAA